jgi:hypothetical protein
MVRFRPESFKQVRSSLVLFYVFEVVSTRKMRSSTHEYEGVLGDEAYQNFP